MKVSSRLSRSFPVLSLTAACVLAFAACSSSNNGGGTGGSSGSGTGGANTGTGGNNTGTGGNNTGTGGNNTGTGGNNTGSGGTISTGGTTGTGGTNTGTGGNNTGTGGNTGAAGSNTGGHGGAGTGSGGSQGTGGANGGSSGGCVGLALCDNFDKQTAGSGPDTSLWSLIGAKTCSTQGTPWPFAVDSTQSHSPPNSLKVSGGDSCGPLMLNTSAFTNLTGGEVYGRFYMRVSDVSMSFDHGFFMALGLTSGTLNTGMQDGYLQLASEAASNSSNAFFWQTSDSNIMPEKNSTAAAQSTYPKSNTAWTCIEFHTSQSTGALETWVDGTAVTGLTFVPGTTSTSDGVHNQWAPPSPFKPTSIAFGWTVFSGENLTVWFDDIAVGTTRIGCQ